MKKLMVAVAAVAMAACAQAVTMNWGASYTYDYDENGDTNNGERGTSTSYYCLLFDNATYARSTMMAAIAAGTETFGSSVDNALITGSATSDGSFVKSIDSTSLTVSDNYANGYLVIFNAASVGAADHAYITAVTAAEVPTSGAAGIFYWENSDRDMVGTNTQDNWTAITQDVPEPTSGLLLLLGMAGLALRRRRA